MNLQGFSGIFVQLVNNVLIASLQTKVGTPNIVIFSTTLLANQNSTLHFDHEDKFVHLLIAYISMKF